MEAIKFHITIKSDTIKIPELSKFIGKRVEIILLEDNSNTKQIKKSNKLKDIKGKINFDDNAVLSLREKSKI